MFETKGVQPSIPQSSDRPRMIAPRQISAVQISVNIVYTYLYQRINSWGGKVPIRATQEDNLFPFDPKSPARALSD